MSKQTDNEAFVRRVQAWLGVKADGWAGTDTMAAWRFKVDDLPVINLVPDPELIAALKIDEGLRLKAYKDTVGVWTVGYGRAHVSPNTVWTQQQAEAALIEDVTRHNAEMHTAIPWAKNLDPVRRRVLENLAFNLGVKGLLGFKNTLEFVRTGQYDRAADGMMNSKWARQVKGRAVRLSNEMRTGIA